MNTKYTPIILGTSVVLISVLLFTFLFSSNNDMDNDGVVDDKDQCPQIYGPIENYGCPNKKSPRSDNGKSIDDSNSYFEKQVDSLINGTIICPDISCFYDKDGNRNIIVGKKIQYDGTWYWYKKGVKKKVNHPGCLNEYFGNLKAEIDKREAEEEDTGGDDDGGVGGDDDGGVGGDDDGDVGGDDDGGDGQTITGQTTLETLENELKFWKKELLVADFNDSYMRENIDIAYDFLKNCEKLEKQYDPKYKPTYDEIKKIFN